MSYSGKMFNLYTIADGYDNTDDSGYNKWQPS